MIRIAVVMGQMHSGGKKNLVMEYYQNIDRDKVQFDFICDSDSNSIPEELINKLGGKVYRIAPYQKLFPHMSQLYKILKNNNYKIVHSYNNTLNVISMIPAKLAGVPVRISESISMAHKSDKKTVLKNILKPMSRLFVTDYLANGDECGKWQFGEKLYNAGKVRIFKTVVDSEFNDFDPEVRKKTREEYNISDNFVVGHIGRLTAQKNTLFLIDIFNELLKIRPESRLLLIGDGDLREQMLERIKGYGIEDSILYLGRREDIQQFYNAMDVFLLPSLYEGLPVVGVESQCSGLPVYFSTEIPVESSACDDLGIFISLEKNAAQWAAEIAESSVKLVPERRSRRKEIIASGFDSKTEAGSLQDFYLGLLK